MTLLQLATAVFHVLAEAADTGVFRSLRQLFIAGEKPNLKLLKTVVENGLPGQFLNLYGPTEVTTYALSYAITAESLPENATSVPIGRPITNTVAYVVNAEMNLVPVGVPGELLIGGAGVSLGYQNLEELTARRVVPDRFGNSGLLYRSGDIVRQRHDGDIEFLHRIDHQVKVRGNRVELAEVEAMLLSHDDVIDCVTLLRNDVIPGEEHLVAYVKVYRALQEQEEQLAEKLKGYVRCQAPGYMVPSFVVPMVDFPHSVVGKVDRKSLPRPGASQGSTTMNTDHQSLAAVQDLESKLLRAFRQVLNAPGISERSSFFNCGGHSLLALRLLGQLKQSLELNVSLRDLLQAPSAKLLARRLLTSSFTDSGSSLSSETAHQCLSTTERPIEEETKKLKQHRHVGGTTVDSCSSPAELRLSEVGVEPLNKIASLARDGVGEKPASLLDRSISVLPAQEQFWILRQLSPSSPNYNVPVAVLFDHRLELGEVKRSLRVVVERHAVLRSVFSLGDGNLQQTPKAFPAAWRRDSVVENNSGVLQGCLDLQAGEENCH